MLREVRVIPGFVIPSAARDLAFLLYDERYGKIPHCVRNDKTRELIHRLERGITKFAKVVTS